MEPGEKALKDADSCISIGDVRSEIDRIDRRLVRLLAERQGYIEAAARIKERESDVRVEWRIEEVVSKVLAEAEAAGLSKDIAEPVWRELIETCISHERECWRALNDRRVLESLSANQPDSERISVKA